jgi:hypothetical protein
VARRHVIATGTRNPWLIRGDFFASIPQLSIEGITMHGGISMDPHALSNTTRAEKLHMTLTLLILHIPATIYSPRIYQGRGGIVNNRDRANCMLTRKGDWNESEYDIYPYSFWQHKFMVEYSRATLSYENTTIPTLLLTLSS